MFFKQDHTADTKPKGLEQTLAISDAEFRGCFLSSLYHRAGFSFLRKANETNDCENSKLHSLTHRRNQNLSAAKLAPHHACNHVVMRHCPAGCRNMLQHTISLQITDTRYSLLKFKRRIVQAAAISGDHILSP